jgi:hypothetical protein
MATATPARTHVGNTTNYDDDDDVLDVEDAAESIRVASLGALLHAITLDTYRQCNDFEAYLRRLQTRVVREVNRQLKERGGGIKVMLEIDAEYVKPQLVKQEGGALERARRAEKRRQYEKYETDENVATVGLITKLRPITHVNQIVPVVRQMLEDIRIRHITKMQNGSGFVIRAIVKTVLKVAEHMPLAGRSYLPLPAFLNNKTHGTFVNVLNQDLRCFGYAILASIKAIPASERPERTHHYTEEDFRLYHLRDVDVHYPVLIGDLERIEREIDIPINVFTFFDDEGKARKPIYTSKLADPQTATDLLFWEIDSVGHFAWIRNFSAFVYDLNAQGGSRVHWCKRCFSHFYSPKLFKAHLERCCGAEGFKCIHQLPTDGTSLEFMNTKYQEWIPFAVYADFEAITKKVGGDGDDTAAPPTAAPHVPPDGDIDMDDVGSITSAATAATTSSASTAAHPNDPPKSVYQEHVPISVGLKLVSSVPGVLDDMPYETHTGPDVTTWFLEKLLEYQKKCTDFLFAEKAMVLSRTETILFGASQLCYLCGKAFSDERRGLTKVRDHDHISGKYRGAAHSECNLKLRLQRRIPVFLHNFRGYDSHLIIPALGTFKEEKLSVIAQTLEKYLVMSFSKHLVFKDSCQFLSCKLSKLTENLLTSGSDAFIEMRKGFAGLDDASFQLLLRKGVYPYDYMDMEERLGEAKLPEQEDFFSRLTQEPCSDEDYAHAQDVWRVFNCHTMLDYHNLYLKCDVLQLVDVFESFRKAAIREYQLDPAHYISLPQLSWDAMLHLTGCKLDLLSDDAMFNMIHQNLRGGVAMISKRRGTANNKYMKQHFDPKKPSKYLLYVDANNLYGWAMSQRLPDSKFEWIDEKEWESLDWLTQTAEQDHGYIVECDLGYPDELHDIHSDYPLAPERMTVDTELLSAEQVDIGAQYQSTHIQSPKLVPNLFPKEKYSCHHMTLKFYLEHGMQLRKIHRVIRFHQSAWLAPYIEKNSTLRAAAKNDFEKDFFKLMNNSVYGKTTENVLNRKDIRLEHDRAKARRLINKPHCLGFRIFTPDIAAIALQKTAAEVNKPTYVGFAVLEYAKLLMYDFHYNHVLKQWPDGKARLILTDTDSLLYEIETEDMYEDIRGNATLHSWFDFSKYPKKEHPLASLYDNANQMVIGKMKDEAGGQIMVDVVGLRAKMYSYKIFNPITNEFEETEKAKGIQHAAIKTFRHEDYVDQLENPHENRVVVRRIGHYFHINLTYEQSKRALCGFDDKRYLLPDLVDTLAHGHYKIRELGPTEAAAADFGAGAADDGNDFHSPRTQQTASRRHLMAGSVRSNMDHSGEGASTLEDEHGDLHLLVRRSAVVKSAVYRTVFSNRRDDGYGDVAYAEIEDSREHDDTEADRGIDGGVHIIESSPILSSARSLSTSASAATPILMDNDVVENEDQEEEEEEEQEDSTDSETATPPPPKRHRYDVQILPKCTPRPTRKRSIVGDAGGDDDVEGKTKVSHSRRLKEEGMRHTAEEAKRNFVVNLFPNADVDAASMLVEYAMVNLDSPLYAFGAAGVVRALGDLRARLTKVGSPAAQRALELLDEARDHEKTAALNKWEKLLFVMSSACKVVQHMRMKSPHKVIFLLISGRSERWYRKDAQALLTTLSTSKSIPDADEGQLGASSSGSGSDTSGTAATSDVGNALAVVAETGGEWAFPDKVKIVKNYATKMGVPDTDVSAAIMLVKHGMLDLSSTLYRDGHPGVQRALVDLRTRLAASTEPPPLAKRALELLDEAHNHDKAVALSAVEKLLLIVSDASKVVKHKLLFSVISGRSELWYGKNARALLTRLSADC